MKLGLDSYSLRWQGWDALRLVEYSARTGLDSVQLSGRRHFRSLEPTDLLPVKQRADELGLVIEIGMGSVDRFSSAFNAAFGTAEEQLRTILRAAELVGSPNVHVILGGLAERTGTMPIEQHVDECVRAVRPVASMARDLGVKLAFENHGDLLARELAALVEEAGPDYVGVCLDTGNPATAAEDPLMAVEILAQYTVTSHMRDSRIWAVPRGAMVQGVPMGQGSVDWKRAVATLLREAPNAIFSLETLTGRPPRLLPYLERSSEFWKPYATMPASDFARFVALAQAGAPEPFEQVEVPSGSSGPGDRTPPAGELGERLVAQQLRHFEESVRYCRETLGIGERDR